MSDLQTVITIAGVDVGGTNTDTVIMKGETLLGYSKRPTTSDVTTGVYESIKMAIDNVEKQNISLEIAQLNIGTTHFLNAVIQNKNLVPVSVIRLCGTCSNAIPPFSDFPQKLRKLISGPVFLIKGGFEFDGREIQPLDKVEIRSCLNNIRLQGINHVVISGVFLTVSERHENEVGKIIEKEYSDISYTLSYRIGQMGLLGRENAGILNECLKPLCQQTINSLYQALKKLELHCPLYFTQNDGTILNIEQTLKYPVHTFSSGPTNSMRGSAFLSKIKNAIVADIGGTSCDIGVLVQGFPREASAHVKIGGVRTNFHMPDVFSVGLGGGSLVLENENSITVGPLSVGCDLLTKALIFGGSYLTATDIAVAGKLVKIGNSDFVNHLSANLIKTVISEIHYKIENCIDQVKLSSEDCPLILVGGGSILLDISCPLKGISQTIRPSHFDIANAIGAALSQVSGVVDRVVNLSQMNRLDAIDMAKKDAIKSAIVSGASPNSVEIIEVTEVPLAYLPGNATRIVVKSIGNLNVENRQKFEESSLNADLSFNLERQQVDVEDSFKDFDEISPKKPYIDQNSGEWELSPWDVECIAIGTGILGCGGGGNTHLGKLTALNRLKEGKKIRVITPNKLEQIYGSEELVFHIADMGAPVISIEKLQTNNVNLNSLKCMLEIMNILKNSAENKLTEIKEDKGLVYIDDYKLPEGISTGNLKHIKAVMSAEIGGANGICPLIVAADLDIPVVDADRMGRAYPELQMDLPFIYGEQPYPACLVDHKGRRAVILYADSAKTVENHFRNVVIEMGCGGTFITNPISISKVKETCALYSISRAWRLGDAIHRAHIEKKSPIEAILETENGKLFISGKIADVQRSTEKGFSRGILSIEGFGKYANKRLVIYFQNENLVAIEKSSDSSDKVLACTPDLITVVDTDSGIPIQTEEVRYGLRVSVLALACSPAFMSPQALDVVGPQAFGYSVNEIQFKPIANYSVCIPIPSV